MKRGLKEFQKVYDTVGDMGWLALDLAQNLSFRFEYAKDKNITEEDVDMAYGLTGGGRKYPHNLMGEIHALGKALGFTREDYIENSKERTKKGNVNLFVLGKGKSKDLNMEDVIEDGFGSAWSARCPTCGKKSMSVVRPGKVQCQNCG